MMKFVLIFTLAGATAFAQTGGTQGPTHTPARRAASSSHSAAGGPTKVTGEPVKTAAGLEYWDIKVGTGAVAQAGQTVEMDYTGWLTNGKKFDSSIGKGPFEVTPLGSTPVIKGWNEGIIGEGRRQTPAAHSARTGLRSGRLSGRDPAEFHADFRRATGRDKVADGHNRWAYGFPCASLCPLWFSCLGFHDFAAAQAVGANADALACTLHLGADRAEIDVPAPLGHVVGVADVVPELRPLAANITNLCHDYSRLDSIEG